MMISLIDGAVCGRSAAGQVRITEFSDYTSDQMAELSSVFIDLDFFFAVCTAATVARLF